MFHSPKKLKFYVFGSNEDPLSQFSYAPQALYLRCYLDGLDAETIIEEGNYFDRDYLAGFSAFYSVRFERLPKYLSTAAFLLGAEIWQAPFAERRIRENECYSAPQ